MRVFSGLGVDIKGDYIGTGSPSPDLPENLDGICLIPLAGSSLS